MAAPHPVSWTLARLLHPLTRSGLLKEASTTALLPASALGIRAVEELHQQAVAMLNFQESPPEHLHGRLAFNVLPWKDDSGEEPLGGELAWEVGQLLGLEPSCCALQLLLLSAFHGHAYSIRAHLEEERSAEELRAELSGGGVRLSDDPPSLLDAQEGDPVLAHVAPSDKTKSHWLWAVSDSMGAGAAGSIVQQVERLAGGVPVLRSVD
jgi:aspartate-semialdehyde dehydrogenase